MDIQIFYSGLKVWTCGESEKVSQCSRTKNEDRHIVNLCGGSVSRQCLWPSSTTRMESSGSEICIDWSLASSVALGFA